MSREKFNITPGGMTIGDDIEADLGRCGEWIELRMMDQSIWMGLEAARELYVWLGSVIPEEKHE